jgi:hypothetical protein
MMDMNAFDDNLKNRTGGFRLEPRKEVWERVAQELDSKKRKRRLVWFWWFAPLLLAGGAIWFSQSPSNEIGKASFGKQKPIPSFHKEPAKKNSIEKETNQTLDNINEISGETTRSIMEKNTRYTPPFTFSSSGKGVVLLKRSPEDESSQPQSITPQVSEAKSLPPVTNALPASPENEPKQKIVSIPEDSAVTSFTTIEETTILKPDTAIISELTGVFSEPVEAILQDSLTPVLIPDKTPKKDKKPSRGTWRLLAGVGIHNHTGKGIGLEKSMSEYNNGGLNNNAGGGPMSPSQALESPEPGPGFMLGIERSQPFGNSKHWSWVGGLYYQYQSFSIGTGALKDTAISYATGTGNVTAANYYMAGNNEQQKGSQHRAHLLAAVQWHMDKKQRWTWQNGFYGGIVLSSDYLIPQNAPRGWVSSEGLTQTGYTGIETGFIFRPSKWGAGIFGQYNLSNSLKITGPAPQYWRGIELRVQYNLSSNSLKK